MWGGGGGDGAGGGDLMGTRVSLMASLDLSSFLTPGTVGVAME